MNYFCIVLLIIPLSLHASNDCKPYDKAIDKIKAKMRLGYTVKQGEKLKTKLTKLQNARVKCERSN